MTINPGRNGRSGHNPNTQPQRAGSGMVGILAASDHRIDEQIAVAEPAKQGDGELERRVRNFLAQRSIPSLRRLTIEVDGNSVIVRGHVRTYYEKQLAVHCCQRVAGVINVIDQVDVSSSD